MNKLEMYKNLSKEDKLNLTEYSIYNSIYINANNYNKALTDEEVDRIEKLTYYLYLKDQYYNFSENRIADFITIEKKKKNIPLEKLEESDKSDIYIGIDNDNYDFLLENKMER